MATKAISRPKVRGMTIQQLADLLKDKTLNLNPVFQRKSVWKRKDRNLLIDSILRGYPIPAVILLDRTDERGARILDVIDGKQRLEAVFLFMGKIRGHADNGYAARLLEETPDGREVTRTRTWAEFGADERDRVLNCQIPVVIVSGGTDLIRDVFVRINRSGKKLSRAEILNAQKENSEFWRQVDELAKRMRNVLRSRGVVSAAMFERMEDLMLVAEIVLAVYWDKVMDKKRCVDQMMSARGPDLRRLPNAVKRAEKAIRFACLSLLSTDKRTRFANVSDFYSLVFLVSQLMDEGLVTNDPQTAKTARAYLWHFSDKIDRILLRHREFKETAATEGDSTMDYIRAVQSNSDGKHQRNVRNTVLKNLLRPIFKFKDPMRSATKEQRRLLYNEGDPICPDCGEPMTFEEFTADHIYPHSRGGKTILSNLRKCCRSCNSRKRDRIIR